MHKTRILMLGLAALPAVALYTGGITALLNAMVPLMGGGGGGGHIIKALLNAMVPLMGGGGGGGHIIKALLS